MRTIYLDLDGTVLDVKERLYRVFADTVTELGGVALPLRTYWQHKRVRLAETDIAQCSGIGDIYRYSSMRSDKIEAIEYLRYDRLFPQTLESLTKLRETNRLVLTTMRTEEHNLNDQLRRLGLSHLLDKVLLRGIKSRTTTKVDMITTDSGFSPGNSIIVGDTEGDIRTGKTLGIGTVAVLSGVRSRNILASHHPDRIIRNIYQLVYTEV